VVGLLGGLGEWVLTAHRYEALLAPTNRSANAALQKNAATVLTKRLRPCARPLSPAICMRRNRPATLL